MTTPLEFMSLFTEFKSPTWSGWRDVLAKLTPDVREFWCVAGRGAGKSRIVALLAAHFAARHYQRAPGERVYVGCFAPDRKQASITFRYVVGFLRDVPELAALIEREAGESIDLRNGVTVEVITASRAAPRGRAYALAIVEEAAFLPTEQSANPDTELLRGIRPALARVPGSLLAVVSSPYARRGELYSAWQRYHEGAPAHIVFIQAATRDLNPAFPLAEIERAIDEDPAAARAEYGGEFRDDVESYVSRAVVDGSASRGVIERAPVSARPYWLKGVLYEPPAPVTYCAFVDPSGGAADSMTLAIAHPGEGGMILLDAIREARPPFSPEAVVTEFAGVLRSYGLRRVVGDRYAGEWPREQFRKAGIHYIVSEKTKSEIYRDALVLLNSQRVKLLDQPRLLSQIAGLERRTARGGRDSIDHAPGGHDDASNAALGAIALASTVQRSTISFRNLAWG